MKEDGELNSLKQSSLNSSVIFRSPSGNNDFVEMGHQKEICYPLWFSSLG